MAIQQGDALTAVGPSTKTFTVHGNFNLTTWGDFQGTYRLERQVIAGQWSPCTDGGQAVIFSGPVTEVCQEPQPGVLYRLNVLTRTSGTLNWALTQ